MVTLTFCITISEDLDDGKFTGKPEGVMNEAVSIKKINNRKMISVMDDMLKLGFTLCFDFKSMQLLFGFLKQIYKVNDIRFHRMNQFADL